MILHINDHNPSIVPIVIATRHEKFELCVLCLDHAIYAEGRAMDDVPMIVGHRLPGATISIK